MLPQYDYADAATRPVAPAVAGPHLNALKHGRRSASPLLPGEDAEEFQRMRQELYDLHRPRTGNEARCVEAMASHEWGMERCRRNRDVYHGKLHGLLHGDPAQGAHCEPDPHRWHHSAMDCALEEGRLGRLQDRERRKLAEMQKLRRQNLIARTLEADAAEVAPRVEPPHLEAPTSEEKGNGENPERTFALQAHPVGRASLPDRKADAHGVTMGFPPTFQPRTGALPAYSAVSSA